MMSAAAMRDPLRPRSPGGNGRGALLSLAAHAGLVAALAYGVGWRSQPVQAVSAELWAAVPQIAAPRAAAPEPAPEPAKPAPAPKAPEPAPPKPAEPDPQVAIEKAKQERALRERQEREEREKLEREKALREKEQRERAERERREREAIERRDAELRQKNLERIMGQASAAGGITGTAAVTAAPSASYAGKIVAAIRPNIVMTEAFSGNPAAEVEVRAAPDGTVTSRRLTRPSGNKDWDDAVLRAIDRTGALPRDTDGRVPSALSLTFRPLD